MIEKYKKIDPLFRDYCWL